MKTYYQKPMHLFDCMRFIIKKIYNGALKKKWRINPKDGEGTVELLEYNIVYVLQLNKSL